MPYNEHNTTTAIEYGLIAALIVVAVAGLLVTLGPALQSGLTALQKAFG